MGDLSKAEQLEAERASLIARLAAIDPLIRMARANEVRIAARADWERIHTATVGTETIQMMATWPEPIAGARRWYIGVGRADRLLAVYQVVERRQRYASRVHGDSVPLVAELEVFRRFDLRRPQTSSHRVGTGEVSK